MRPRGLASTDPPSPLRGGARGGGNPGRSWVPPSLSLPRKGGGDDVLHVPDALGVGDRVGHRHERGERGRQRHRPGAGAAAAVRRRERLVQVDVHGVDAEVAGAHLADDGVEVGAVGVEVGAGRVHGVGNAHHIALEQAAGVGVGEHDGGNLGREPLLHLLGIDGAVRAHWHRFDAIAQQRRGRRIGAVRGIGHQHDRARLAARRQRRLDRHHAAQLAVSARLGRHGDGGHARELAEPARQLADQLDGARDGRERLQGMDVAEARQPRHALVEARVVLHGAGAEREQPGVDAEVLLGEAHVVAHGLGLAEARQADRRLALECAEARGEFRGLRQVDARGVRAADLEDQRLLDGEPAVAAEGLAACGLRRARPRRPSLSVQHGSTSRRPAA